MRQLERRIAALEQRATAQSSDNNKALSEVATLREQIAALEMAVGAARASSSGERSVKLIAALCEALK